MKTGRLKILKPIHRSQHFKTTLNARQYFWAEQAVFKWRNTYNEIIREVLLMTKELGAIDVVLKWRDRLHMEAFSSQ